MTEALKVPLFHCHEDIEVGALRARASLQAGLPADALKIILLPFFVFGRLPPEDLEGGTITVSNIGAIGGTYAAPISVPPETAIVTLGRTKQLPRFGASGEVERAVLIPVSWGTENRAVDDATMARCCARWKVFLENLAEMLLHSRQKGSKKISQIRTGMHVQGPIHSRN